MNQLYNHVSGHIVGYIDFITNYMANYLIAVNKKNAPCTCQVVFGDKDHWNSQYTPGMQLRGESTIYTNKKGINQFRM